MLELQNICYRVSTPEGEQDILKNVSVTIPDHKLVVFTGPNGGGKTTLAKIIMGLVRPTSGRVLTDLAYGPQADQRLDVHLPAAPRGARIGTPKSSQAALAAVTPLMSTMGTPGPGFDEPPVRYRLRYTRLRFLGLNPPFSRPWLASP